LGLPRCGLIAEAIGAEASHLGWPRWRWTPRRRRGRDVDRLRRGEVDGPLAREGGRPSGEVVNALRARSWTPFGRSRERLRRESWP